MTGYVLKRASDGAYVSKPGAAHSYTKRLEEARIFATAEEAWKNACQENEVVIPLNNILKVTR